MLNNIPHRDQWARVNRAYLEALSDDTDILLSATDDFVALKISAEKSALNDRVARAKLLLDAKNAREVIALLCQVGRPGFEKTLTYGCVFYDLMAQLQARISRTAEIRSSGLNEILVEQLTKSTNSDNSGFKASSDVARSFIALARLSIDAMKSNGTQLAARMERNVAAVTIASVQISNTAKDAVGVFLRESSEHAPASRLAQPRKQAMKIPNADVRSARTSTAKTAK